MRGADHGAVLFPVYVRAQEGRNRSDRKVLADMAVKDITDFNKLAEMAKEKQRETKSRGGQLKNGFNSNSNAAQGMMIWPVLQNLGGARRSPAFLLPSRLSQPALDKRGMSDGF
jgi:hypothetical protein